MFVNVGFAAAALLAAIVFLHPDKARSRPAFDVARIALVSAGLFALVLGFSRASTAGWPNTTTLGFAAAGVIVLAGFSRRLGWLPGLVMEFRWAVFWLWALARIGRSCGPGNGKGGAA